MPTWAFVDDTQQEAEAFAEIFTTGENPIDVRVLSPSEARDQILTARIIPLGVLMDVELSAIPGELGTGPGIAQDIRVLQRSSKLPEFPIVRFSSRQKVLDNVRGDPTSSDLFDLKIEKEELTPRLGTVQHLLLGLEQIYERLNAVEHERAAILELLGVTDDEFGLWGHESLLERLESGLSFATHVAATALVGTVLMPPGLLLNEDLLSFRLGVDSRSSGAAWGNLKRRLEGCLYKGVGAPYFQRWWAQGLDSWWWTSFPDLPPLSTLTISERIKALNSIDDGLRPLVMPRGSAGERPWRHCSLTLEAAGGGWIPVDPAAGVKLTPWSDLPPWVDPQYAALSAALEQKDPRSSKSDINRLKAKYA
jgi:hypothetical protein